MKEDTFRVVDTLARSLGRQLSISELTERARGFHERAHYKNIHQAVETLEEKGTLRVTRRGRAALVELDLSRGGGLDDVAAVALEGKRRARATSAWLDDRLTPLEQRLSAFDGLRAVELVEPQRNARLNRIVLLAVLSPSLGRAPIGEDRIGELYEAVGQQASDGNMRVDLLALTEPELVGALGSEALTAPQVLVTYRANLLHPGGFGWMLHRSQGLGQRIVSHDRLHASDPNLGLVLGLEDEDIATSLDRLGYEEMGTRGTSGRAVSMELAVTAALARGDARRRYGAAVALAKSVGRSWNPRTLAFLALQHNVGRELLGFARTLARLLGELDVDPEPLPDHRAHLETLEARLSWGLRGDDGPAEVDEQRLLELLKVYDVLG